MLGIKNVDRGRISTVWPVPDSSSSSLPHSLTLSSVILVLPLREETELLLSLSLFRPTGNYYLLLPTSFCFAESIELKLSGG